MLYGRQGGRQAAGRSNSELDASGINVARSNDQRLMVACRMSLVCGQSTHDRWPWASHEGNLEIDPMVANTAKRNISNSNILFDLS